MDRPSRFIGRCKIRILMLTHNILGVGGSFIRSHSLAKGLHNRGHEVTLVASNRRPGLRVRSEIMDGPKVVEVPDLAGRRMRHGGLSPIDLIGRTLYGLGHRYDIVHGFSHRPAVSVPSLALRATRDMKFVSDWADLWGHGGLADLRSRLSARTLGTFDHYWERRLRRWADGITCVSSSLKSIAADFGLSNDRILFMPPGCNVDVIKPKPKQAMRRRFGIDPSSHVAVYLGHSAFDERLLAESFVELGKVDPRMMLIVTGPELPLLSRLAANAEMGGRISHMGFQAYNDLGDILACGDVMLLPLTRIGANQARFPNRFGDYLAAGRPIVTNPTGDVGEVVLNERVGLVTEEHPRAFAEGVARLFEDRELCEELGSRARQLAENRYDWRILAGEVERLYEGLLS